MKRFLLLFLLLTATAMAQDTNLIVPGKSFGPVTPKSTLADLVRFFGAANVKPATIHLGEGETVAGTVVFPKDPKRRLEVTWTRSKRVADIRFSGRVSVWHTAEGLTLGTTLAELQRLNEVPFKFAGFGWDCGGVILSWGSGRLAQSLKNVWVTLDLNSEQPMEDVLGDSEFLSSEVLKKNYPITVGRIRVEFNH